MIVLPDVVPTAVAWLHGTAEVEAIYGDRIGLELPEETDDGELWPALRIDPIGGVAVMEERFDQQVLQIHSFARSAAVALAGARTARAAIYAMSNHRVADLLVVTNVDTSSPQLLPDLSRTPPIRHATFSATVTVRPDP
jgi:hypothetical protein